MVAPDLDVGGVQPNIRPIALDGTGAEGVHALVDLAAKPGDLALADAFHPSVALIRASTERVDMP